MTHRPFPTSALPRGSRRLTLVLACRSGVAVPGCRASLPEQAGDAGGALPRRRLVGRDRAHGREAARPRPVGQTRHRRQPRRCGRARSRRRRCSARRPTVSVIYQGSPNELILTPLALSVGEVHLRRLAHGADHRQLPDGGAGAQGPGSQQHRRARRARQEGRRRGQAAHLRQRRCRLVLSRRRRALRAHHRREDGARALQGLRACPSGPRRQSRGPRLLRGRLAPARLRGSRACSRCWPRWRSPASPRPPSWRSTPSINESKSIKDFAFDTWTGYFVPKGTPAPVVDGTQQARWPRR